jgi:hypothetical protein
MDLGQKVRRSSVNGLASGLGCQEDAISVCKLLVQVASGVACPGNARHLQHTTAA